MDVSHRPPAGARGPIPAIPSALRHFSLAAVSPGPFGGQAGAGRWGRLHHSFPPAAMEAALVAPLRIPGTSSELQSSTFSVPPYMPILSSPSVNISVRVRTTPAPSARTERHRLP